MATAETPCDAGEYRLPADLKFQTVMDAPVDAVIPANRFGRIVSRNPGVEAILGIESLLKNSR